LPDNARLSIDEGTAPFIDIPTGRVWITDPMGGLLQKRRRGRDIIGKSTLNVDQRIRIMLLCPWQHPQLPRNPFRGMKIERIPH
jgi:hypothetical protein